MTTPTEPADTVERLHPADPEVRSSGWHNYDPDITDRPGKA